MIFDMSTTEIFTNIKNVFANIPFISWNIPFLPLLLLLLLLTERTQANEFSIG